MITYIVLAFVAVVVLVACFPTRKEAASWHTDKGVRSKSTSKSR